MASFQMHDQENHVTRNVRNLRSNKSTLSTNGGRSVLGIINDNSRFTTRSRNDGKTENKLSKEVKSSAVTVLEEVCDTEVAVTKNRNKSSAFRICQDDEENDQVKIFANHKKISTLTRKELPSCSASSVCTSKSITNLETNGNVKTILTTDEKLEIPSDLVTDIYQHRQPLKDLKLIDEEEPMSEGSFIETYESSPMVVDRSLTIITPTTPQIKPPKQKDVSPSLYDMEEYREEIFAYLREAERRHRPKPCYMHRQPDVTYSMRTVLVDWLVEVSEEYRLHTETLYLAVSFIDRFLSLMSVVRGKLQLLGTAAMFIASKYEEIYPPEVSEFVYITDDTYTKKQVLRMEHLILKVLKFDISVPTPLAFITHFMVECKLNEKTLHLAMYLCELSLLEGDPYLQYLPSLVACSAIALARHCLESNDVWSEELCSASGYTLEELAPCVCHFNDTHKKAKSLAQQAVCEKYKSNKWHNASEIPHRPLIIT